MQSKILFHCFFSLLIFSSCSNEEAKSNEKQKELLDKEDAAFTQLKQKYDVLSPGDRRMGIYAYSYQENYIEQHKLLGLIADVHEIYKKDSNYVFQFVNGIVFPKTIFHITVSPSIMERIKLKIEPHSILRGCFIARVLKIVSRSPSLELNYTEGDPPNEDGNGATDSYVSIGDFGSDKILIFNAELVDYYISEKRMKTEK